LVSLHDLLREAGLPVRGGIARPQAVDRASTRRLAQVFSVSVAGFTVMDNHLHLLVRLDPEAAAAWSDEEVVRRWGRLFPPRDRTRRALPVSDEWV